MIADDRRSIELVMTYSGVCFRTCLSNGLLGDKMRAWVPFIASLRRFKRRPGLFFALYFYKHLNLNLIYRSRMLLHASSTNGANNVRGRGGGAIATRFSFSARSSWISIHKVENPSVDQTKLPCVLTRPKRKSHVPSLRPGLKIILLHFKDVISITNREKGTEV